MSNFSKLNFALVKSIFFASILVKNPAAARKTRITWVNGMAHSMDHMLEGETFISSLFCGKPVHYCYNPTAMTHDEDVLGYLGDLTQAGAQKLGRITAEVENLVKHLKEAVSFVGKRGMVIHIAHSQGALITFLASKQLTPQEMNQIEVLSFGGAAALKKSAATPFSRCINYYSINDPLLWVVPEANQALRSGFVRHDNEFCFLAPKLGDPVADHNLYGPTYGQALQWEGARYQRKYVSLPYRSMRKIYLLISFLLKILWTQLFAITKLLLRPIVQGCVACLQLTQSAALQLRFKLFQPIVQFMILLIAYVKEKVSGQEKYVPVSVVLEPTKNDRRAKKKRPGSKK